MLLARENGSYKVFADTYTLEFPTDRPFVYVGDERGNRVSELFTLSSIHPMNGRDDTTSIKIWQAEEGLNEITLTLEVTSSAWQSKTISIRCMPRRFSYGVTVYGEGQIAEAAYLGGYYSAQIRWGSGFFWSGQHFKQGFNPEPTCDEIYTFAPETNSAINMTGVPLPGRGDWFFTPAPFCFAFETQDQWLGIGIEAKPGDNNYSDYQYHGSRSGFYLSLNFDGHTKVSGHYRLPDLVFEFGQDPYTLLAMHVHHLRSTGLVPTPDPEFRQDWWHEPIFCGWGAQCHLAKQSGGKAQDYANQPSYEAFLHTLVGQDIIPGTIVLDDKWQKTYGDNEVDLNKWPDLPGFIRSRRESGQHVLLWLKAWAPEGIPIEECMTNAAGLPVSVDPTHPAFERRLRASIRRMLSPEGYDADGFKIDFSARIPCGPGIAARGSTWGLELMRLYLAIIQEEARKVKPEAFIITHTPHPYLADLMGAVRLNDINTGHNVCGQMLHRTRIASIACPEALIDMDNWPMQDKATWLDYLSATPNRGIPALYFASHINSTGEAINEDDYDLLRGVWAEYRASLHANPRAAEKDCAIGSEHLGSSALAAKRLTASGLLTGENKPLKSIEKQAEPGPN